MRRLGSFLVIIGLLAVVLGYINRVPRLLIWIYQWGDGVAWGIKAGIIVLGLILLLLGRTRSRQAN